MVKCNVPSTLISFSRSWMAKIAVINRKMFYIRSPHFNLHIAYRIMISYISNLLLPSKTMNRWKKQFKLLLIKFNSVMKADKIIYFHTRPVVNMAIDITQLKNPLSCAQVAIVYWRKSIVMSSAEYKRRCDTRSQRVGSPFQHHLCVQFVM